MVIGWTDMAWDFCAECSDMSCLSSGAAAAWWFVPCSTWTNGRFILSSCSLISSSSAKNSVDSLFYFIQGLPSFWSCCIITSFLCSARSHLTVLCLAASPGDAGSSKRSEPTRSLLLVGPSIDWPPSLALPWWFGESTIFFCSSALICLLIFWSKSFWNWTTCFPELYRCPLEITSLALAGDAFRLFYAVFALSNSRKEPN